MTSNVLNKTAQPTELPGIESLYFYNSDGSIPNKYTTVYRSGTDGAAA